MTLTVFVGDVTADLASSAQTLDASAYLITKQNINQIHRGTVYLSLGDVNTVQNFYDILSAATEIIYTPPARWSDGQTSDQAHSLAWYTEHYVRIVSGLYNIPVKNLSCLTMQQITCVGNVPKSTSSKTRLPMCSDTPSPTVVSTAVNGRPSICISDAESTSVTNQLWVVGCSTTYGIGVAPGERYCDLLRDQIGLELKLRAWPGSSIGWAASQIMKSKLQSGDIVIWGLTTLDRFQWFLSLEPTHVTQAYYAQHPEFDSVIPLCTLDTPHRLYESLDHIEQVTNFCTVVGARLLLVGIHSNLELSSCLAKHSNFVMIQGLTGLAWNSEFSDYGSDGMHPGPLTHRYYTQRIVQKLTALGWIQS